MPPALDDLVADVDTRFAAEQPRSWPDPRPGLEPPADEDYSRVTDPDRYVTLQQRCRAWISALLDRDLATARSSRGVLEHFGHVETVELRPRRQDAVAAFVHFTADHLPGVVLAMGDPAGGIIDAVPACGCDACDDGSEHLLGQLDEIFRAVVTGVATVEQSDDGNTVELVDQAHTPSDPGTASHRWRGATWL